MAKNKIGLDTTQFDELAKRFSAMDKEIEDTAKVTLKRSVDFMQPKLEEAVTTSNYPSKGKYSKGNLKHSIIKNQSVKSNGVILEVPFGFNTIKAPYSYYLINGTPRMKKSTKIWGVFNSRKTMKELADFQAKVMWSSFAYLKQTRGGK